MKNNYQNKLKQFISLLFFCCLTYFSYLGVEDSIKLLASIGEVSKVTIYGYMNNVSPFILLGFLFPTIPFCLLVLFTGLNLPKLMFYIMLIGAVLIGIWGHSVDSKIRGKLNNFNYKECLSDKQLALKYSSRTYVLDLKLCDED